MKNAILTVVLILFSNIINGQTSNGEAILQRAIDRHDPSGNWPSLSLHLHIQEPRIGNPQRYSILKMNNATNEFELRRNRDQYISTHIIDRNGESRILLDNSENIDSALIEKYGLDPNRNIRYQEFYYMFYGLPMTLTEPTIETHKNVETTTFNNEDSYKLEIVLKQPLISKHWIVYISTADYKLLGMEIVHPDDAAAGERLYFEKEISINNIVLPRIRHWHEYPSDEYVGSDLILLNLSDY